MADHHWDHCGDCRFLRSEALGLLYSGQADSLSDAMVKTMRHWQERGRRWVTCSEALTYADPKLPSPARVVQP